MIRSFRKQWLRWRKQYERKAFRIYQDSFKAIAQNIPWSNLTESTYRVNIEFNVTEKQILDTYVLAYRQIGVVHGKRTGLKINRQINKKNFTLDGFISRFERNIISWLLENGGQRVTSVRSTFINYLNEIIATGINDGKSISEIATEMQKHIRSRSFYRNNALMIARTETTTAANFAATIASETSGVLMDKVWVSSIDSRTRRKPGDDFDHVEMNGVRVPLNKPFIVSGEEMMFPGDPKGSAGNTINCRCTVAQVVRRDSLGNIIFT